MLFFRVTYQSVYVNTKWYSKKEMEIITRGESAHTSKDGQFMSSGTGNRIKISLGGLGSG